MNQTELPKALRILQICSYYSGSSVHKNLFIHLDVKTQQGIYVPIRINEEMGLNNHQFLNGSLFFENIWSWYHRILYRLKIFKAARKIETNKEYEEYDMIHAHTWFSDGGIAWLLNKKHNKPYIITIRNTDINIFYSKLFYLRRLGQNILEKATKIVFVSPCYSNQLLDVIPVRLKEGVKEKSEILPNGIDSFWFDNRIERKQIGFKNRNFNMLFVGEINKNKNLIISIKSFIKLREKKIDARFTLVGFENKTRFELTLKKRFGKIEGLEFVDKIKSKEELIKFYRNADLFFMPSITETFGLVYIEALSQGLPIIYSKNQGVDGFFNYDKVGIAVNPRSIENITTAIEEIYTNYQQYIKFNMHLLDQFRWENIAKKYNDLYKEVLNCNSNKILNLQK